MTINTTSSLIKAFSHIPDIVKHKINQYNTFVTWLILYFLSFYPLIQILPKTSHIHNILIFIIKTL